MWILDWLRRKPALAEASSDLIIDWSRDSGSDGGVEPVDAPGFGHRAHRPDPKARYGFDVDPDYRARNSGAT